MKLLENIVKNVPREKIHPDAKYFAQDRAGVNPKSVYGYESKPSPCEIFWIGTGGEIAKDFSLSEDAATTVITREELVRAYDLVEQGYTLWFGGECPITERDLYIITESLNAEVRAALPRVFDWSANAKDPIIAYKVVEPVTFALADVNKVQAEPYAGSATLATGVKHDSGKPRFSLLPLKQVWQVVEVLEAGAKKYAPDNWQKVDNQRERYFNAAQRHLVAWWQGEKKDPETGLSNLAHVVCCVLFLMWGDDNDKNSR